MHIMSDLLPDTYINALVNIVILPSGDKLKRTMETKEQRISHLFKVLKKCRSKFDCLIYEMLLIKDIKPSLNTQSDSTRAKLFT